MLGLAAPARAQAAPQPALRAVWPRHVPSAPPGSDRRCVLCQDLWMLTYTLSMVTPPLFFPVCSLPAF